MADKNDIYGEYERAIEARRKLEDAKTAKVPQPTPAELAMAKLRSQQAEADLQKRISLEVDTIIKSLPEAARRAGETGAGTALLFTLSTWSGRVWSRHDNPKRKTFHDERESAMYKDPTGRMLMERLKALGLRYYIKSDFESDWDRAAEELWYENQREELYGVFDKTKIAHLDAERNTYTEEQLREAMMATVNQRLEVHHCAVCGRGTIKTLFFGEDKPTIYRAGMKYKGKELTSSNFSHVLVLHMRCKGEEFQPD